jgi:elongation factor P--beta-lysine ligase
MSKQGIMIRAQVVEMVRHQFLEKGFVEVIPQLMWKQQPIEPTIYPFSTQWSRNEQNNQQHVCYFSTSPERYLKRVIATCNIPNVFAVSHALRNMEGAGKYHQPEFLMVEWYQQDTTWLDMMKLTQQCICDTWKTINPTTAPNESPWPQLSIKTLWLEKEKCDLASLETDEAMKAFAQQKGYSTDNATWEQLFHQIIFNDIEPSYPPHPFFLIDFPSKVSPLAAPQENDSFYAQRFEVVINNVELANGNTEQTDMKQIGTTIDSAMRCYLDQISQQHWAGVGLGIDRLAMMICGAESVAEIQWPEGVEWFE